MIIISSPSRRQRGQGEVLEGPRLALEEEAHNNQANYLGKKNSQFFCLNFKFSQFSLVFFIWNQIVPLVLTRRRRACSTSTCGGGKKYFIKKYRELFLNKNTWTPLSALFLLLSVSRVKPSPPPPRRTPIARRCCPLPTSTGRRRRRRRSGRGRGSGRRGCRSRDANEGLLLVVLLDVFVDNSF